MEKTGSTSNVLILAESKMGTLGDVLENAHTQASSSVRFTLQLKDLKGDFDTIMKSLREKTEGVGVKERLLEERARLIETKENELGVFEKRLEKREVEIERKTEELGSIQKKIEECDLEFKFKENKLSLVRKSVDELCEKLSMKKNELGAVEKSMKECNLECERKKEELWSQIRFKKNELTAVRKSVDELSEKFSMKKNEMGAVEKSIKECNLEFERKKEDLGSQIRFKKNELTAVRKSTEVWFQKLSSKKDEVGMVEKLVEELNLELDRKKEELGFVQKRIEECGSDIGSKENELTSMRRSVEQWCEKLRLLKEEVAVVEKSKEKLFVKQKEVEDCCVRVKLEDEKLGEVQDLIDSKKHFLDAVERKIEKCCSELESNKLELDTVRLSVNEKKDELNMKEKSLELLSEELKLKEAKSLQLDSLRKTLEESLQDLETKARHFQELSKEKQEHFETLEERLQEIETREKQFEGRFKELELKEKQSLIQVCSEGNGGNLQCFLNEHLKKHDFVINKISSMLRTATDAGKMVLNAVQGFYPSDYGKGKMEFDQDTVRRSCIVLLDQLFIDSPEISPQVREEALKLACEWKAKMRVEAENNLEVLGFLQLLAAFKLGSYFSTIELKQLLDTIAHHRQEPILRRALGIVDKAVKNEILEEQVLEHSDVSATLRLSPDPAKFVLDIILWLHSEQKKMGGSGFEGTAMRNYVLLLGQLKEVSPRISQQVQAGAKTLADQWETQVRHMSRNPLEVLGFLQFLAIYDLVNYFPREKILRLLSSVSGQKMAPELFQVLGFLDMVPEFIGDLIRNNHYLAAVGFVCAFNLMDKFPLDVLLKRYLESIRMSSTYIFKKSMADAKVKAINFEVASLRVLIEVVEDQKLKALLPPESIKKCITHLENLKTNWSPAITAPDCLFELQLQIRQQNRNVGALASNPIVPPQHNIHTSASSPQPTVRKIHKRPRTDPTVGSVSPLHNLPPHCAYWSGLAADGGQNQLGSQSVGKQHPRLQIRRF